MKLRVIHSCETKMKVRDGEEDSKEANSLQSSLAMSEAEVKQWLLIIYSNNIKAQKTIQEHFTERIPMTWNYLAQLIKQA